MPKTGYEVLGWVENVRMPIVKQYLTRKRKDADGNVEEKTFELVVDPSKLSDAGCVQFSFKGLRTYSDKVGSASIDNAEATEILERHSRQLVGLEVFTPGRGSGRPADSLLGIVREDVAKRGNISQAAAAKMVPNLEILAKKLGAAAAEKLIGDARIELQRRESRSEDLADDIDLSGLL